MLTKKKSVAKINTLQLVARVLLFNGVHPDVVEAIHVPGWNCWLVAAIFCKKMVVGMNLLVGFLGGFFGQHAFLLMEREGASN